MCLFVLNSKGVYEKMVYLTDCKQYINVGVFLQIKGSSAAVVAPPVLE